MERRKPLFLQAPSIFNAKESSAPLSLSLSPFRIFLRKEWGKNEKLPDETEWSKAKKFKVTKWHKNQRSIKSPSASLVGRRKEALWTKHKQAPPARPNKQELGRAEHFSFSSSSFICHFPASACLCVCYWKRLPKKCMNAEKRRDGWLILPEEKVILWSPPKTASLASERPSMTDCIFASGQFLAKWNFSFERFKTSVGGGGALFAFILLMHTLFGSCCGFAKKWANFTMESCWVVSLFV